ncbi:MAG TPA: class I SAM-dependent methyltransferase [Polyangiales bacterium]
MSGRRKVGVEHERGWIFNRMADVYAARPAYPAALLEALLELAGPAPASVLDLGAGVGHLALPLAARGHHVTAVEPARAMLEQLELRTREQGLTLSTLHATAEQVPCADRSFQLVLIADALHFLDAALTGQQVARLLTPGGALAIVLCELGDTPFMRDVVRIMEESAPRRPRAVLPALQQVAALANVQLGPARAYQDDVEVDPDTLERILRSISYIGPAMNAERFTRFRARIHALSSAPRWARRFTLHAGRRGG